MRDVVSVVAECFDAFSRTSFTPRRPFSRGLSNVNLQAQSRALIEALMHTTFLGSLCKGTNTCDYGMIILT